MSEPRPVVHLTESGATVFRLPEFGAIMRAWADGWCAHCGLPYVRNAFIQHSVFDEGWIAECCISPPPEGLQ